MTTIVPSDGAARLLASLASHLPAAGITRVGDLTGLDVLGIPVAFAVRPNSRSLSVTQGKSLSADEARLGAVMEALEQTFAERGEVLTICRGARRDLIAQGRAAADLSLLKRSAYPPKDDESIAWAGAASLISGAQVLVPLELAGLDLRAGLESNFSANPVSSLGLAAGASWEAAATHALLEVIEHNATAAIDIFGFLPGFARPVRHREGDDAALDEIVSRIERAGLAHQLFDLSSPGGLPAIGALVDCPDLVPGWVQFAGFACRFSPEHAAEAALLEAVQSRLTLIAGARDDLKPASYRGRPRRNLGTQPRGTLLRELPHDDAALRHAPPRKQLDRAIGAAISLGAQDVLASTVGGIAGLVSVVRIIASGIEASGFNATTALGQRTLGALFAAAGAGR